LSGGFRVNVGMKVFMERRKKCAMKIPDVDKVGEHGGEIRAVKERMWGIECCDNGRKK
jgi:hypothetical protein